MERVDFRLKNLADSSIGRAVAILASLVLFSFILLEYRPFRLSITSLVSPSETEEWLLVNGKAAWLATAAVPWTLLVGVSAYARKTRFLSILVVLLLFVDYVWVNLSFKWTDWLICGLTLFVMSKGDDEKKKIVSLLFLSTMFVALSLIAASWEVPSVAGWLGLVLSGWLLFAYRHSEIRKNTRLIEISLLSTAVASLFAGNALPLAATLLLLNREDKKKNTSKEVIVHSLAALFLIVYSFFLLTNSDKWGEAWAARSIEDEAYRSMLVGFEAERNGNPILALKRIERDVKEKTSELKIYASHFYRRQGSDDKARATLADARNRFPTDVKVFYYSALDSALDNDRKTAKEMALKALTVATGECRNSTLIFLAYLSGLDEDSIEMARWATEAEKSGVSNVFIKISNLSSATWPPPPLPILKERCPLPKGGKK